MKEQITRAEYTELIDTVCSRLDLKPRDVSNIELTPVDVKLTVRDHSAPFPKTTRKGQTITVPTKVVTVHVVSTPDLDSPER